MLKGKNAIVTGVSKGIGLETVKLLLEAGVKVAGWSRQKPELEDPNFRFVKVDISNWEQVQAAHLASTDFLGNDIHFLINNAGFGVMAPIDEVVISDWKAMFDVNVHGLMYCTKMVVPDMKRMDAGHIINVSSIAGLNGIKNMSGYVATKHAVTGLGHSLMMELRDWGIKVTNVYPGSVNTAFFDDIDAIQANENMMRPEDIAKAIVDVLDTHPNLLPADLELRPLRPKGKPQK
ncbi:MAG: SDR family NAD(P)-dependent oxidoreductase [Cyclobacteriaceae bacterium]